MPKLSQMLDFIKADPVTWAAFLAIPVILICIACLMPRGKGRVLVNAERILIILGVAAVYVAPFVIDKVKPELLGFDPRYLLFEGSPVQTLTILSLTAVLIWGLFTGRSYITQALYGMIACIALPFGLINLVFPTWAEATVLDTVKSPEALVRLLMYAACVFIPVWLIRSGEYKFRMSSIWHLISGFTVGGCVMTFITETDLLGLGSHKVSVVLHMFDDFTSVEAIKDSDIVRKLGILFSIMALFFLVIIVAGFLLSLVRVILKTGDRMFVSESFFGFVLRLIGNVLANGICGISIIVLPQVLKHTGEFPMALLYLAPILVYLVILLVTSFLADTCDIKRGIKRANKKLVAETADANA